MRKTPDLRVRRWIGGLTATAVLCVLTACTDTASPVPQSSWTPPSSTRTATTEPESETKASDQKIPNDLAKLPLRRTIGAGPLTVDVEYSTRLPLAEWSPERSKPLRIKLQAVNTDKRKQKIYLTKVTANVTAYDDRGQIGDTRNVTDSANINPGYIVRSPNTYNQSLSLPTVDSGSLWITVDLMYEMVLEVDKTKDGRDFAKQVATDTITVPLSG